MPRERSSSNQSKAVFKDAVSQVLVPFYPVAGRLGRVDNGRLQINCNNQGVLFIEAETDCAIDDLGDFLRNVELCSSFQKSIIPMVTTFRCGGVSIGTRLHHVLADGIGALHFINTWCDVANGLPISITPQIDRTILCSQDPPNPKFQHVEFHNPLTLNTTASTQNPKFRSNYIEILKITPHQLDTLKANVNPENSTNKHSTYAILTAHIWRCTSKARGLADDHQTTMLNIAVDGRFRLRPPLPDGYFGNAISNATIMALSSQLSSETLKDTVERIDREIKRMDDEYLRSAIDYLQVLDDLTPAMLGPNACRSPNLSIVSWMRLPF
eukprot:XP_015580992.1 shikimate O-hydroxycinnamoyltransferase [Ricinus communis]